MKKWVSELMQHANKNISLIQYLVIAIAGNKCDLKDKIQLDEQEFKNYAKV